MIGNLLNRVDTFRSVRLCNHSPQRKALAQLPPGLYEYWSRTAGQEFKGIPVTQLFFSRAAEGLMDFFDCARNGKLPCALPSSAADSVWHAWRRFSPDGLNHFCHMHFGRTIPHRDGDALGVTPDAGLANCLVLAQRAHSLSAPGIELPPLFTLDARLCMPGGYGYRADRDRIGFQRLDGAGKPHGTMFYVAALMPLALLEAGLVTQDEFLEYERRRNDDGGGDAGSASSSSDRDRDSDSDSDGGSDSGSSCGSGCGGGGD